MKVMSEPSVDISKLADGVIAFGQETYMISRFDNSVNSCFSRFDQMGNELTNYLNNTRGIKSNVSNQDRSNWFNDKGISCSILSPETNGWQKGRVRVKLQVTVEFYPDNPELFMEVPPEEDGSLLENGSPLDDLRGMEGLEE
jgi:hypothetical protein